MKKVLKYLGWAVAAILIWLVILVFLVYLPPVQNFLCRQAVSYVASHYDREVKVGRLSIGFPLKVELDEVYAGSSATDTSVYAGRVRVDIGLRGIWRGEVSVKELSLDRVVFGWENDTTGMRLKASLEGLALRSRRVNLREKLAEVDYIRLKGGTVSLVTGADTLRDTTASEPFDWAFEVDRMELERVDYEMKSPDLPYLGAGLESGRLTLGKVVLGKQQVEVDSLSLRGGWCRMVTAARAPEEVVQDRREASVPWTVRAGSLALENGGFELERAGGEKMQLVLSGIGIRIDSIYNRGTAVRAVIQDLRAVQQDGVTLTSMQARVALDSAETVVRGAYLRTLHSRLMLNARADTAAGDLLEEVPLKAELEGEVGLADIQTYYRDIPRELRNKAVKVKTSLSVGGRTMEAKGLELSLPGYFRIRGQGRADGYKEPERMQGRLKLEGDLQDMRFARQFLGDSSLRLPRRLKFSVQATADRGNFQGEVRVCRDTGCLQLEGSYDLPRQAYAGTLELQDFPIGDFLTADSLGTATARIQATGHGFSWAAAQGNVAAVIGHLDFRGHRYEDIGLEVLLDRTHLSGNLTSRDPAVPVELIFRGDSVGEAYEATLSGRIDRADLQALHFAGEPLSVGMEVDLRAAAASGERYTLHSRFDSLWMQDARTLYRLGGLTLDMDSDRRRTGLKLVSGDLDLQFRSDTSLTAFAAAISKVSAVITQQVGDKDVDMQQVSGALPDFNLNVAGGRQNAIAGFLKARHIGFQNLTADIGSRKRSGVRIGIQVNAPYLGSVRLDSVTLGAWQTGKSFVYTAAAGSSAEAWKGLFNLNVNGRIQGDRLRLELKQKNAAGEVGFDLGTNLTMRDSSFTVSFFPMTPILGYSRWIVNADNRVTVSRDWKIKANLRMSYLNKLVDIQSLEDEGDEKDRLKVEIAGIDLQSLSRLVPYMPELEGLLNTNLQVYTLGDALGMQGDIGIADLYYQRRRVGTLGLDLQYRGRKRLTNHEVEFGLKIDSIRRAVVEGSFATSEDDKHLAVDADIPSLPLSVVNAFLPAQVAELGGELKGELRLRGTTVKPQVDGELAFRDGTVGVTMLGTTFRMDPEPLPVKQGKITFRQFRFMAADNSALVVNGDISLTPFNRMGMDLTVKARDFEVVNVRKNEVSLIYGKAYTDIDARLSGAFSALNLTGNIGLLNRTAITYTLRSSGPQLVDKSVDLVRFVSFRDTTLHESDDLTNRVNTGSFSLRMMVAIGDQVGATVELSEDGSDYISIQGGGNLVLSVNPESGLILSGKYILNGGTVVYNIPIAGKKEFSIRNGSYVEWTGDAANPVFGISAAESVKATVEDGDRNRLVTFDAIIRIQGTLNRPDISFDLSSPNDMVIQNQLATFSPEERSRQALNLLVYNTYTAPGAAKSGNANVANNALYSFVENELNKYTRKAGITLGVDAYHTDENTVRRDFTYQFSRQLFNDRVRVKIGGRISTDNNEVQENHLEDNLVDDVSIEYVFTKKRNLYLKVFRHSNYESVLDGEVTQTGIGIVWRKNFQKFRDLFKRKKKAEEQRAQEKPGDLNERGYDEKGE